MDIEAIRAFLTVVETKSFTLAGRKLGLAQGAVSQQVKRLEDRCGRQLLRRERRTVDLTGDGEAFLPYARDLERASENADIHLREPPLTGTVRLGIAEDVAGSRLPALLGRFKRSHAAVRLQIETGLSGDLSDRLERGDFDLVVSKRPSARHRGGVILREPLAWCVAPTFVHLAFERPLPLALHPRPSVTAEAVMGALRNAGIEWHLVLTSPSIAALRAGVLAGLAVSAFGLSFLPDSVTAAPADAGLPTLPDLEFGLERREGTLGKAEEALAKLIEDRGLQAMRANEAA